MRAARASALRSAKRAQKKIKARLEAMRDANSRVAGPADLRGARPARSRRARVIGWAVKGAVVIGLMALARACSCGVEPVPLGAPTICEPCLCDGGMPRRAVDAGRAAKPDKRRIRRRLRTRFVNSVPPEQKWLVAFRLQVAARGPRLAACLEDSPQAGAIRWTTRLSPAEGLATDHAFEPDAITAAITKQQKACLSRVLSKPRYTLPEPPEDVANVSLILEF